jgi:hypothetical protein
VEARANLHRYVVSKDASECASPALTELVRVIAEHYVASFPESVGDPTYGDLRRMLLETYETHERDEATRTAELAPW